MNETAFAMGKFLGPRQAASLESSEAVCRNIVQKTPTFGNSAATALSAASGKPPYE